MADIFINIRLFIPENTSLVDQGRRDAQNDIIIIIIIINNNNNKE